MADCASAAVRQGLSTATSLFGSAHLRFLLLLPNYRQCMSAFGCLLLLECLPKLTDDFEGLQHQLDNFTGSQCSLLSPHENSLATLQVN
jgi:hypothetical protein